MLKLCVFPPREPALVARYCIRVAPRCDFFHQHQTTRQAAAFLREMALGAAS